MYFYSLSPDKYHVHKQHIHANKQKQLCHTSAGSPKYYQPEHFPSTLQILIANTLWVPKRNVVKVSSRSPGLPFVQRCVSKTHKHILVGLGGAVLGTCWQGWGRVPCRTPSVPSTVAPPGMLRGLCIPWQHLPEQHLTPRRSPCLADNLVPLQTTTFRLTGRQLLKRSYVGMAENELITTGSSVFIFASICMIHGLLTFLLLEKSVQ